MQLVLAEDVFTQFAVGDGTHSIGRALAAAQAAARRWAPDCVARGRVLAYLQHTVPAVAAFLVRLPPAHCACRRSVSVAFICSTLCPPSQRAWCAKRLASLKVLHAVDRWRRQYAWRAVACGTRSRSRG